MSYVALGALIGLGAIPAGLLLSRLPLSRAGKNALACALAVVVVLLLIGRV